MRISLTLTAMTLLSACAMSGEGPAGATAATEPAAIATLRDAQGAEKGTVTITAAGADMLRVAVAATGLPSGPHAFHIHTIGLCEAPGFTTAGGHWNPAMRQHGADNPMGAHAGDMPNLNVGGDGRASATATVPGTLDALLDSDGAAAMIHAAADDYKTDPTGNAGARLACGVLTRR